MGLYNKLLLSSEGGIISTLQQSKQAECATIAIGLGGTGVSCLETLKSKVFNRLQPDDPDALVPVYSHIKFLAIDSDKSGLPDTTKIGKLDAQTEYLSIANQDIVGAFRGKGALLERRIELSDWLQNDKISINTAAYGAGGVRQVGRFLLFDKFDAIYNKFYSLIEIAKTDLMSTTNNRKDIRIHVFAGLSGGTGAGTFLDVCYILRKVIQDLSLTGDAQIFGYFFMPDINLSVSGLSAEVQKYIKMNASASLKELDYCMSFESNADSWERRYHADERGRVSFKTPPVDLCHLISAKDMVGNIRSNAYSYAMNVVSDYIMDFLVEEEGSLGSDGTNQAMGMQSHISNFQSAKEMVQKQYGAQYQYCVLGAANAQLPMKEILTYLASALFREFSDIRKNSPSKSDLEKFLVDNGLDYDQLWKAFKAGVNSEFDLSGFRWKDIVSNGDAMLEEHYSTLLSTVQGTIQRNIESMKKMPDRTLPLVEGTFEQTSSIYTRIAVALRTLLSDSSKGIFYAAELLRGTKGIDLIDTLSGYIAKAQSEQSVRRTNRASLENEVESTRLDFLNRSKRRTFEYYEDSLKEQYQNEFELHAYQQFEALLTGVKEQLEKRLYSKYLAILVRVMGSLIDTFGANYAYLNDLPPIDNTYIYQLTTVKELQGTLDAKVREIDIPSQLAAFTNHLIDEESEKQWIYEDESKIARCVNQFFTGDIGVFSDYAGKTLTDYLKDKYGVSDLATLTIRIRTDILETLDTKANPLYWVNGAVYNLEHASPVGYCSVPGTSPEIVNAGQDYIKNHPQLTLRRTKLADRITVLRCLCGVPLFGYNGLYTYESEYSGSGRFVGKHIYAGKHGGVDWNELATPIPLTLAEDAFDEYTLIYQTAKKHRSLYDKACKLGLVVSDEECDRLLLPDSNNLIRLVEEIENAIADINVEPVNLARILSSLRRKREEATVFENESLESVAFPNATSENMKLDFFASYYSARKRIEQYVSLLSEVDTKLAMLSERLSVIQDEAVGEDQYFDALISGVLSVNLPKVSYSISELGILTEVDLSTPSMPYGKIPLYQGYISFVALRSKEKKNLLALVNNRLENNDPSIIKGLEGLNRIMTDTYTRLMQQHAEKYPAQYDEILSFIRNVRINIQKALVEYGID